MPLLTPNINHNASTASATTYTSTTNGFVSASPPKLQPNASTAAILPPLSSSSTLSSTSLGVVSVSVEQQTQTDNDAYVTNDNTNELSPTSINKSQSQVQTSIVGETHNPIVVQPPQQHLLSPTQSKQPPPAQTQSQPSPITCSNVLAPEVVVNPSNTSLSSPNTLANGGHQIGTSMLKLVFLQ